MSLETIELTADNLSPTITLNKDPMSSSLPSVTPNKSSVNFGSGIELLMNDKKRNGDSSNPSSPSADINLGDLDNLAKELDGLTPGNPKSSLKEAKSSLFSGNISKLSEANTSSRTSPIEKSNIKLNVGPSIANNDKNETWDGYKKFNDIPIAPELSDPGPQMSKENLLREKFKILRKLEAIEKKGIKLSKKYTMESSLTEMQGEYETIKSEKERGNSVKFQGRMLMATITGLEFLNNKFDPFDLRLDGWAEQVNENIDDYDDIFGELHEKYQTKATMAPELKLLFQLSGSAIMLHMTNTMFKSAMPGMDDIMKQNPELMQQFTQAAVNQMGEDNPGFGGFMNNIINPDAMPNSGPPRTVRTQGSGAIPIPKRGGDVSNRPDIGFGRGNPDQGVNINNNFDRANGPQRSNRRPEMKGPSDISNILSGLKTKESVRKSSSPMIQENISTISIQDLKDLQNTNSPMKSKRRQKSDKNTISLDI